MKTLVDTSVWIDHLIKPNSKLIELLENRLVLVYSGIIGELACGSFKKRAQFLSDLKLLPRSKEVSWEEVIEFIDLNKLNGKGIGWVDAQILLSTRLSDATLFSHDKKLMNTWKKLKF